MMRTVTVTDVLRSFADYINRVAYRGEGFVLVRGGEPVVELSRVPLGTPLAHLPALLDSLPRLGEEEATAFTEDLARARAELGAAPSLSTSQPPARTRRSGPSSPCRVR